MDFQKFLLENKENYRLRQNAMSERMNALLRSSQIYFERGYFSQKQTVGKEKTDT